MIPQREVNFTVGGLRVRIQPKTKMLNVWLPRNPQAWPDELAPTLRGGEPADHLTIPWVTRRNPPFQGRLYIHLTYSGVAERHEPVWVPSLDDLRQFVPAFQAYQARLVQELGRNLRRVTVHELERGGYWVTVPKKFRLDELIRPHLARPKKRYRLDEFLNRPGVDRWVIQASPRVLRGMKRCTGASVHASRFHSTTGEWEALPLILVEGRGWYTCDLEKVTLAAVEPLERVLTPLLGPCLLTVLRELQADVDVERVRRTGATGRAPM